MAPGTWCFGHDTGVTQDYVEDLADGTGTAGITGVGDTEKVVIDPGEDWISSAKNLGTIEITLSYDQYGTGSGTPGTIYYRTAATKVDCKAAGWTEYTVHFTSLGWVQIKLTK
ncbi:hypothetical protein KKC06_06830 [Patescibacteria group bacterium]|nr:hypothetical protein [Patescibacteria group bacterium]